MSKRKRKLNNKKVKYNGLEFDSKKEFERYIYLKNLLDAGQITDLELQKEYVLIPAQCEMKPTGEIYKRGANKGQPKYKSITVEQSCKYKADFVYKVAGKTVVEDVKGFRKGATYAVFKIKKKLMLYIHNIRVIEI